MGKLAQDSFSGVSGLKTALVKIRTVLSHREARRGGWARPDQVGPWGSWDLIPSKRNSPGLKC